MPTFFFHSGMTGAPTNTNAAGSTLGIIRACLVDGFNSLTPSGATVASEVMVLTYSSAHGYENLVWIQLDGATGGSIVKRATVTSPTTLTIEAPGFANGVVAGTLSTKVAPADWEEVFTGTLKAVFRSKVEGPGSTRFFYRVSDTVVAGSPRILRGFESMTDVDTGIGPFPTIDQESGDGLGYLRANSSTPRPWCIVSDRRTVYLVLANDGGATSGGRCFGDFSPYSSFDLFGALANGGNASYRYLANASLIHYVPRVAMGTGTASTGTKYALFTNSGTVHTYPSSIDGGMTISRPVLVVQAAIPRGEWRGLMGCSSNPIPTGQLFTILENVGGVTGRVLIVRDSGNGQDCVAFPIDEEWV